MKRSVEHILLICIFALVCCILVFAPLAKGAVQLWAGTIVQVLTLAVLGLMILRAISADRSVFPPSVLFRGLTGLAILCLVAVVFSSHKAFAAEGMVRFLTYIVLYFAVVDIVKDRRLERWLVYVIIGTAFLVAIVGILKRVELNPFVWWDYTEMGDYKSGYVTGVYVNQNHLAGFLEMVIPLSLVMLIIKHRPLDQKFVFTCISLVLILTQAFTLSKGGWVSTLGALAFLFVVLVAGRQFVEKRQVIILALCAVCAGAAVLAVTPVVRTVSSVTGEYPEDTLASRVRTWEGTLEMIRANPVTGTGPGTFSIVYPRYQVPGLPVLSRKAHIDYLQFVSEIGVACIPMILMVVFLFFRNGFRILKVPSRQKSGFCLGAMAGVFALMIHGFYDFNLYVPANAVYFSVIAGLTSGSDA